MSMDFRHHEKKKLKKSELEKKAQKQMGTSFATTPTVAIIGKGKTKSQ
jgi:hypothetical protein